MSARDRSVLSAGDAAALEDARAAAVEELLSPEEPSNAVGIAIGVKRRRGEPTGDPAVLVLVRQKVEPNKLAASDRVPPKIGDHKTDVVGIGTPSASSMTGAGEDLGYRALPQATVLSRRVRPAKGGYSVGHFRTTVGSIATCVYDMTPADTYLGGSSLPSRYYILSSNHTLANINSSLHGDPILQPAPLDGGTDPIDQLARLARYVPLELEPPMPRFLHQNLVDAAVAEAQFDDLDREVHWIGALAGWRARDDAFVGMAVRKVGRTTCLTRGAVIGVAATIDINYGGGRIARFRDQLVITKMSGEGDSGALVMLADAGVALGLVVASSPFITVANHIAHVRNLLGVEVGDANV